MKLANVAYERPADLTTALTLIGDLSRDIRLLAGGQSLLAALNFRLGEPDVLVDINHIDELRGITDEGDTIRIGALTRHSEVAQSTLIREHLPLVSRAIQEVAHPAIRNRGTFGGSIALADPAAEMPACFLAAGGVIHVATPNGERQVDADNYFKGLYETALQPGEIIIAIELNKHGGERDFIAFSEFARRRGDFASAGVAVVGRGREAVSKIRVVAFGVSDKPVRALAAETVLTGQTLNETAIEAATELATDGIGVFADLHNSEAMKRHLTRTLLGRALRESQLDGVAG